MPDLFNVVCAKCDAVNRIPRRRPASQAVSGRYKAKLFDGRPLELDGARFRHHVERNDVPAIAHFWAPWCGQCRAMGWIFERAAHEPEAKVRVVKVNVDENGSLAGELGMQEIPAFFFLKHGRVLAQRAGLANAATLEGWVRHFGT
ncbi:MAG TPA: thioredoxin domain-containing protein [Chloroflexota bacterium]|nr:thioredoxin domain-containing protein [Chloroflexota bacterium]